MRSAWSKQRPAGSSRRAPLARSRMRSWACSMASKKLSRSSSESSFACDRIVRPKAGLGRVGEAGATHDEAPAPIGALGYLRLAAGCVVDVGPGLILDGGNGRRDGGVPGANRHRVAHVESSERGDGVLGPEPEDVSTVVEVR